MPKDNSKLIERIEEKFDTRGLFALAINMDPATLSRRLDLKGSDWSLEEAMKTAKVLDIPVDEIGIYFYGQSYEV